MLNDNYSECREQAHYAHCRCAECRYAECHYSECRSTECSYAECRGAIKTAEKIKFANLF
jgi:hypothetical protein